MNSVGSAVLRPETIYILSKPTGQLRRRGLSKKNLIFVIIVAIIAIFALVAVVFAAFFRVRRRRLPQDQAMRTGGRWSVLNVLGRKRFGQRYEQTYGENPYNGCQIHQLESTSVAATQAGTFQRSSSPLGSRTTPGTQIGASVGRNFSVRSVLTLPAYRATPGNNEQVLGREGDRDGVDVVVDLPTAEEEEELRDEEMEAIYQLRIARQGQIAELNSLRRQRREARQRGDSNALAEVRARSRAASNNNNFDELRQEVGRIQDQRQRSVSSVSYAELGVARHDGTRIRANSNESERMGLLSDAASIAISSRTEPSSSGIHLRERSISSLVSVDSELHPNQSPRTRAYPAAPTTPGFLSEEARLGSNPEYLEADLGTEPIPPPEYGDVPLQDDAWEVARGTTSADEPPPNYSGPNRYIPQTISTFAGHPYLARQERTTSSPIRSSRGVGGIPQLPSLRISSLPAITIQAIIGESRGDNVA